MGGAQKEKKSSVRHGYQTRNCTLIARRSHSTLPVSLKIDNVARFVVVEEKARPILSR